MVILGSQQTNQPHFMTITFNARISYMYRNAPNSKQLSMLSILFLN